MTSDEAFRIEVDAARCDGWGMCAVVLGEHLSLDEWGYARSDGRTIPGGRVGRRARRAAACCPNQALLLVPLTGRVGAE